jgi:hypothetical protein
VLSAPAIGKLRFIHATIDEYCRVQYGSA